MKNIKRFIVSALLLLMLAPTVVSVTELSNTTSTGSTLTTDPGIVFNLIPSADDDEPQ